jgi:hypothetical protein
MRITPNTPTFSDTEVTLLMKILQVLIANGGSGGGGSGSVLGGTSNPNGSVLTTGYAIYVAVIGGNTFLFVHTDAGTTSNWTEV